MTIGDKGLRKAIHHLAGTENCIYDVCGSIRWGDLKLIVGEGNVPTWFVSDLIYDHEFGLIFDVEVNIYIDVRVAIKTERL
jgi:hypothetical protein